MDTRLDKIIIGHCRKTVPVRRRTSPVSWRCVLPVVPGICKLINGLFDPIAVGFPCGTSGRDSFDPF